MSREPMGEPVYKTEDSRNRVWDYDLPLVNGFE